MVKNQYNQAFVNKIFDMSVYQLECEVRACTYQINQFLDKYSVHVWEDTTAYRHSLKTRKAIAKCLPMWAERILIIEEYLPMIRLMED